MALELQVTCSMCGSTKCPLEIDLELTDLNIESIRRLIEQKGWIVEINGEHFDTYCSKKCAA